MSQDLNFFNLLLYLLFHLSRLTNRKLIEEVKTNAHKYLMESIGRVSKLNSEICNLESEINKIEEKKLKKMKIKADQQDDLEDNSQSPPILSRRRKVKE